MDDVRVYVGSDHAGFGLRKSLIDRLRSQGRRVVDLGPDTDAACDYPEFAYAVASAVRNDPGSLGILACATGQGMAIAAGKVRGIRAVVPATVEAARLTRFDNDANILCIGSRLLAERDAFAIVDTWLATGFAGGRHARRIAKVAAIETATAIVFVTESERLRLKSLGVPGRIFEQDPALFAARPQSHGASRAPSLGWIALPGQMLARWPELGGIVRAIRQLALKDLVLVVEDPETSAAATMARLSGGAGVGVHIVGPRGPAGEVESTEALSERLRCGKSFVLLVSGASHGSDLEVQEEKLWTKFLAACSGDAARAGAHFAAITSTEGRLHAVARQHRYRHHFLDDLAVDESCALLGHRGLLPAALLGVDVEKLLQRALAMVESCRKDRVEENPGLSLGVLLGAMAKHGRHKLTLLLSKSLLPLGPWLGRLFADMTGPASPRLVPLHGEAIRPSYLPDRVFVHVQAEADPPAATPEQMEALHAAGQPYIQIVVADRLQLGAEIFRWQMAAAVATVVMSACPPGLASGSGAVPA